MRKDLKYMVDYGVVKLVDDISVDDIVTSLLKEDFIMDIFENDVEVAKEEIEFLVTETQMTYGESSEYFKAIHRRINT